MKALSDDFIDSLIKPAPQVELKLTWIYPEGGPIRSMVKEFRCSNTLMNGKVCKCPTHYLLYGKPHCWLCCVRIMNQLLIEASNHDK